MNCLVSAKIFDLAEVGPPLRILHRLRERLGDPNGEHADENGRDDRADEGYSAFSHVSSLLLPHVLFLATERVQ
jgi:hypothetical protein